jgi:glycerophosphoryl diester phosphodiesterase
VEAALVKILTQHGYHRADDPIYVESFETDSLQRLAESCRLRLIQLIGTDDPADAVPGNRMSFREMATPDGLRRVAEYAQGIGPAKTLCGFTATANPGPAAVQTTSLVDRAHEAGLLVHPYTFRAENAFLPQGLRSSEEAAQRGDPAAELQAYLAAGIDGFFIDQADLGVAVRDGFVGGT